MPRTKTGPKSAKATTRPSAGTSGKPRIEIEDFRPNATEVLNLADAAVYLRVTTEVAAAEAEAGRLPGRKLGGEWRFSKPALAEWLKGDGLPTAEARKKSMLAVVGSFKDDDTLEEMVEEIYRERKRHPVGG